ncbi:MAG: type II toxin-antitoxin system RelE/ParE family toxin [Lysobacteraceae bacterium]
MGRLPARWTASDAGRSRCVAGEAGSRRGCGSAGVPRLIWTPRALADVQRLHRFLAAKNPHAARRAVHAIRTGMKILARHPLAGPVLDESDAVCARGWWISATAVMPPCTGSMGIWSRSLPCAISARPVTD